MTTPQNPEEEPVGDELPEEPVDRTPDGVPEQDPAQGPQQGPQQGPDRISDKVPDSISAEDALWRAIVDNYGDRPEIPVADREPGLAPSPPDPGLPPLPDDDSATTATATDADTEHHFVPPPPPPLPTPPPARLLAWVGLFGVPMFVLVALVAGLALPALVGLILMVWFVGGFVFLVSSMRPGPGEDHDDGARL